MRVQVFQHVPFEGLGAIEPWLAARDANIGWTRVFENPRLPASDSYAWLIVMGGPMSVNERRCCRGAVGPGASRSLP